ncbi:thioredoxin-like protein [Hypoxylon fragiforme]|uniref:thioredoxin-like protein n=1 Tax=Hypoxylon fragiforme TaxID=63214 RepID=UPI0020C6459C|nr:thioredoxin-like protein [Hypoxylon fragiforme]KAI2607101.1 thioredoxin-like protein [Hypoxylon fragiforme]
MRLASLALFLSAAVLGSAQAVGSETYDNPDRENTYFNNKRVPPILELTADNFEKEVKLTKFLVVKYYSPYCPHCIDFAPTYQTLYEYYYTSNAPTDKESTGLTPSFAKYYDIRFAQLNCIAYGDLCTKHDIMSYPSTLLYKDGVVADSVQGGKKMSVLSEMIEGALEKEKPGTRPTKVMLPEPGATTLPDPASDAEVVEKGQKSPKEGGKDDATPAKKTQQEVEKSKPAKPVKTPNEQGISVSLTAESFQTLVTMTQEPWFIKFYAPWCHHCQAMASNWQQLAKEMKGKLNVGEVNCDAESRLCKDAHLRGYPTVLFFKGGERVEYNGLRGLGDFIQYAEKALDICGGIQDVDAASFSALEEKEDVLFVYFYDHATSSEDFMALERLPLSLIGHAKLVKTNDPKLSERFKITTWPRLLVSREGRPTYYTPLTPREMRDTHLVLGWMRSVWLPIVPELTASNAREIMDGKIVVLGILNREDQETFISAKREMKRAANEWMDKQIQLFQLERQNLRDAKQLRLEEAEDRNDQRALRAAKSIRISMDMSDRKEVTFAWVDGVFWQRWIRTTYGIDIKDGERVIINDEDNRRYWDMTITGSPIVPSRVSILETISKVTASPPLIKPKLTISSFEKIFFDIRVTFSEHPYLSFGCVAGIALGCASWFRGRIRRNNFRLDENLPIKEIKEGLLGSTANGKKD